MNLKCGEKRIRDGLLRCGPRKIFGDGGDGGVPVGDIAHGVDDVAPIEQEVVRGSLGRERRPRGR